MLPSAHEDKKSITADRETYSVKATVCSFSFLRETVFKTIANDSLTCSRENVDCVTETATPAGLEYDHIVISCLPGTHTGLIRDWPARLCACTDRGRQLDHKKTSTARKPKSHRRPAGGRVSNNGSVILPLASKLRPR